MAEEIESEAKVIMPLKEYEDLKSQVIDDLDWKWEIERRIKDAELQEYNIETIVHNHEWSKKVSIEIRVVSKSDEIRMLKEQIGRLKEEKMQKKKWYQFLK